MKNEKKSLLWVVVMSLIILVVATICVTGVMVTAREKIIVGMIFGSITDGLLATWVILSWWQGCYDGTKKPKTLRMVDCYAKLGYGRWDIICQGREELGCLACHYWAILWNRETGEKVNWVSFSDIPSCGVTLQERDTIEVVPIEAGRDMFDSDPLESAPDRVHHFGR